MTEQRASLSLVQTWLLASRPKTLTAAVAPVLVGSAVALSEGGFAPRAAFTALFCAVMIQVGTNLHNDVMDFERGTDDDRRLGPLRVTQAGLLSSRQVRWGVAVTFCAAGLGGIYLTYLAGWPVLVLGAAAIATALAYTAGPSPLAYNGFGDLFVLIFFGFVAVCGTAFTQLGYVPLTGWIAALPVGAAITALLVVNNVRDIPTDRRSGRRTLPVVFGRRAGIVEYVSLLAIAMIGPIVLALPRIAGLSALLPLLMLPRAVRLTRFVATHHGRSLNRALAETAQFVFVHGVLLALGIGLSQYV